MKGYFAGGFSDALCPLQFTFPATECIAWVGSHLKPKPRRTFIPEAFVPMEDSNH